MGVGFDALLAVSRGRKAVVSAAGAVWTAASKSAPGSTAVFFCGQTAVAAVATEGVAKRAGEFVGHYIMSIQVFRAQ